MKLGIIIVCHNNEKEIDENFYLNYASKLQHIEICLVNNDSTDTTYDILTSINEQCPNVSVVHIKKNKPINAAVRAGARYMFNQFNLNHIGYVTNLREFKMNDLIEIININKDRILSYNNNLRKNNNTRKTLFQGLFSVSEYLKKLHIKILSPAYYKDAF